MSKKLTSWLVWAGSLCLLATGLQAQVQQIKLTRIGPLVQVKEISGGVLKFDGKQGDLVSENDLVVTSGDDSGVILVFSNGATINIGENSQVEIRQFTQDPFAEDFAFAEETSEPSASQTKIHLTQGELIGNVKSLRSGSSFIVSTPAGAAGIRGTTFRVVFRPQGNGTAFFTITTIEGDVGVTTTDGTVTTPISVTDQQEIEILVEVDDVTGEVTVLSAPADLQVKTASTEVIATVTKEVQEAAEAVVEIVLKAESEGSGEGGGGGTSGDEGDEADQKNENEDDGNDGQNGDDQNNDGSNGQGDDGNEPGGETIGDSSTQQNQTPQNQNSQDNNSPTAGG
ncbi:MAG: hypothetical protein HOH58_15370 [Opitutaceae bacterium]|nr:hypothetical protein [Opitutaceae bacterium]